MKVARNKFSVKKYMKDRENSRTYGDWVEQIQSERLNDLLNRSRNKR